MIKLVKYELMKQPKSVYAFIVMYMAMMIYSIYVYHSESYLHSMVNVALFIFFSLAVVIIITVNNIFVFSHDLNHPSGYPLQLSPISSRKKLNAKILAIIIENLVIGLLFSVLNIVVFYLGIRFGHGHFSSSLTVIFDFNTKAYNAITALVMVWLFIGVFWMTLMLTVAYATTACKSYGYHDEQILSRITGSIIFNVLLILAFIIITTFTKWMLGIEGSVIYSFLMATFGEVSLLVDATKEVILWGISCSLLVIASYIVYRMTAYLLDNKVDF